MSPLGWLDPTYACQLAQNIIRDHMASGHYDEMIIPYIDYKPNAQIFVKAVMRPKFPLEYIQVSFTTDIHPEE